MKKLILVILSAFIVMTPVLAQEGPKKLRSYELLARIPVLDNGRIKPMDTFARNLLLQFSGKDTYERKPAIEWVAKLLFASELIKDDKIFLINNPDIATALGMEVSSHRRYSLSQLQHAGPKLVELADVARHIEQKQRSIVEEEIIRVHDNAEYCAALAQVMYFAFPHEDFNQSTFLNVALQAKELHQSTSGLENKDKLLWSEADKNSVKILKNFFEWSKTYSDLPLMIIPPSNNPAIWVSPWEAVKYDFRNQQTRAMLQSLQNMVVAYWGGNQIQFDMAARLYLDTLYNQVDKKQQKKLGVFSLELAYHAWMPYLWARIFYILAFVCFFVSLISSAKIWYPIAWMSIILGFAPLLWALAARIIIMARPPVTSLYETFIFVACISVALGIWIERINKQWMGILVAAISGSAFLFIAGRYSTEGDTLKMLVAVLNSNFWLATHVTTITMGYAAACVAGVLGHIWLIQACFKKMHPKLQNTYQVMMIVLGIALTLTFLGTNLGGIWADQSWGRFWGWDPKENGALMIVLWCIFLFHARIAKLIGPLGMAIGVSLGVVVVMWAWFGVNLLSIGLHSYGFTSGIANTLLLYVICEVIFLCVAGYFAKKNEKGS